MHYLKCNNCGHLNEVKGEYLIFCSSCNKKLENNYSDWIKRNHDKTLDDFKEVVCISESDIPKKSSKTQSKPKRLKYWIGFAVTFAIFYAIGQFGGEAIVRFFKSEKTSKEVLTQKWIKNTYGSYGLTVETPVKMTKTEVELPPQIQEVIENMNMFEYNSAKGFRVFINTLKFKPVIQKGDLQGAANGSINELKMQKGVTDLDYTEDYIYKNDIPGFIQNGTFKINGISAEFINTGFSKGLVLWQVMVVYQSDDEAGRTAAKRVIESVEINENQI